MTTDQTHSAPPSDEATRLLMSYVDACLDVKSRFDECLENVNHAAGARNMANQRPQHEISIANFTKMAEQMEAELTANFAGFTTACDRARETGGAIIASSNRMESELRLFELCDPETMDTVALVQRILKSQFGPSVAEFLQGLEAANGLLEQESEGTGNIYAPAEPTLPGNDLT